MPSLSVDRLRGGQASGSSVLVLRLAPKETGTEGHEAKTYHVQGHRTSSRTSSRLEIGFGLLPLSSQADIQAMFESKPSLGLTVRFPWNGETGDYRLSLPGVFSGELLRAFSLDLLAPFDFGGLEYDPLDSLASSQARLAIGDPVGHNQPGPHSQPGLQSQPGLGSQPGQLRRPEDGLMALWAALEADLYRFAKDPGLTAAVDAAAVAQADEYRRFARLNELYRDLVKLLVPYGLAPGRWTAWLRGQDYRPVLPKGLAMGIDRILEGRARKPELAFAALTGLLVRYGALVMVEHD